MLHMKVPLRTCVGNDHRMRPRLAALAPLLLLALLASCGGTSTSPEALPADDAPVFVSGDFGEIPVHPLAEEVGEKTKKDGVVAQSFRIRNTSRDQLFAWYEERLDGWVQEAAPAAVGDAPDAAWRARWTRQDKRLIITVSQAPALDKGGSPDEDSVLQYSLSLEPADAPLPEGRG